MGDAMARLINIQLDDSEAIHCRVESRVIRLSDITEEARNEWRDEHGRRLVLVYLFGQEDFEYGKNRFQFSDPKMYNAAHDAAQHQVEHVFQPALISEHNRNGGGYGEVVRVVKLSQEEAKAKGINSQTAPYASYGVAVVDDDDSAQEFANRFKYSSVDMTLGVPDETGTKRAVYIKEVSGVSVPHLKHQQPPRSELRTVRLADTDGGSTVDKGKAKAAIAALVAALGLDEGGETQVAAGDGGEEKGKEVEAADDGGGKPDDDDGDEVKMSDADALELRLEMKRLKGEVATLKTARASDDKAAAVEFVTAQLSDRVGGDDEETINDMVQLYLSDKERAIRMIGKFERNPSLGRRQATKGKVVNTGRLQLGDLDSENELDERVHLVMKDKGVSYGEAYELVRAEVMQ